MTEYIQLLRRNRDFRNLWYGQIISLFGDWFNLIASASLIAYLTGSGIAVGGLFVVRMLAPFLVSPFGGVAVDHFNRKRLLILADVVRAVVVLGFLFVRSPEQVWLLYVLTALQLGMTGVFFPARNAILPDVVSAKEIAPANAITSATWSVMLAMGAAIGGLVAGGWGIYPAFVIDCGTFLLSAVFIARIRYRPAPREQEATVSKAFAAYTEGLRYLGEHRDVLVIALNKASLALFAAGAWEVLQVSVAKDIFPIGEGGGISLGILYAVVGVGTGVGPILARYVAGDQDRRVKLAILAGYLGLSVGLLIISTLESFGVVLAGSLVRAMGGGTIWVLSTQLLLHAVPERVRGRVFASEFALMTLAMATSSATAGWLLDQGLALPSLISWLSRLALIPGLLWAVWLVRAERTADSPT